MMLQYGSLDCVLLDIMEFNDFFSLLFFFFVCFRVQTL